MLMNVISLAGDPQCSKGQSCDCQSGQRNNSRKRFRKWWNLSKASRVSDCFPVPWSWSHDGGICFDYVCAHLAWRWLQILDTACTHSYIRMITDWKRNHDVKISSVDLNSSKHWNQQDLNPQWVVRPLQQPGRSWWLHSTFNTHLIFYGANEKRQRLDCDIDFWLIEHESPFYLLFSISLL